MSDKNRSAVRDLYELASKIERLATQAREEPRPYRFAGRLARDPNDVEAISEVIIHSAKRQAVFRSAFKNTANGYTLLQCAMWHVSMRLWESLWDIAHPNQLGFAWAGEDSALMSAWREKVQAMARACGQESTFSMTPDEYFEKLVSVGLSDEDAESFLAWQSQIQGGGYPPLLK